MLKNHCNKGAELVSNIGRELPDISLIILNHHETADGNGYPRGMSSSELSQICCLFILAERFIARLSTGETSNHRIQSIAFNMRSHFDSGNFRQPLKALLNIVDQDQ